MPMEAAEREVATMAAMPDGDHDKYDGRAQGPLYRAASVIGPPGKPWKKTNARVRAALNMAALLLELPRAAAAWPGPPHTTKR